MTPLDKVREFMVAGGQEAPDRPSHEIDGDLMVFRADLMGEELDEFVDAFMAGNMVGMVDALADLLYVTYGTFVSLGVDGDRIFDIVHAANMRKYANGVVRDERGKVQKPEGWVGPEAEIASELNRQSLGPRGGLILPGNC